MNTGILYVFVNLFLLEYWTVKVCVCVLVNSGFWLLSSGYLIFYYCSFYLQLKLVLQSLKQFNMGIFYPFVLSPL